MKDKREKKKKKTNKPPSSHQLLLTTSLKNYHIASENMWSFPDGYINPVEIAVDNNTGTFSPRKVSLVEKL